MCLLGRQCTALCNEVRLGYINDFGVIDIHGMNVNQYISFYDNTIVKDCRREWWDRQEKKE